MRIIPAVIVFGALLVSVAASAQPAAPPLAFVDGALLADHDGYGGWINQGARAVGVTSTSETRPGGGVTAGLFLTPAPACVSRSRCRAGATSSHRISA